MKRRTIAALAALLLATSFLAAPRATSPQEAPPPQPPPGERPEGDRPEEPPKRGGIAKLRDWRKADDQLQSLAGQLLEVEKKKAALQQERAKARERFAPEDITPGSVLARGKLAEITTQLDETLGEVRRRREALMVLMRRIQGSREEIALMLQERKAELAAKPKPGDAEAERADRWLEGLRLSETEGPAKFFISVLGEETGVGIVSSLFEAQYNGRRGRPGRGFGPEGRREREDGPQGPPPGGGPPGASPDGAGAPPDGPPDFQRMIKRLEQMEQQNQKARELLERQAEEIRQLREILAQIPPFPPGDGPPGFDGPQGGAPPRRGPRLGGPPGAPSGDPPAPPPGAPPEAAPPPPSSVQ